MRVFLLVTVIFSVIVAIAAEGEEGFDMEQDDDVTTRGRVLKPLPQDSESDSESSSSEEDGNFIEFKKFFFG